MSDKVLKEAIHTTSHRRYQESSTVSPRPTATGAPGDSEALRAYRRFFQTHDLNGRRAGPRAPREQL
jgi:hypothetical protein